MKFVFRKATKKDIPALGRDDAGGLGDHGAEGMVCPV